MELRTLIRPAGAIKAALTVACSTAVVAAALTSGPPASAVLPAAAVAPVVPTGITAAQTWTASLADPVSVAYAHGDVWFADQGSDGDIETDGSIGRLTADGYVRNWRVSDDPTAIVAGPDGALWFGEADGHIGRITLAGSKKLYRAKLGGPIQQIVRGPGGMWFVGRASGIGGKPFAGRVTTKGKVTLFRRGLIDPEGIVAAHGALWIVDGGGLNSKQQVVGPYVARMSTSGTVTRYSDRSLVNSGSMAITEGHDGALWIADYDIFRLSTAGKWKHFRGKSLRASGSIVSGPDHALWFGSSSHIGRMTTTGQIRYFSATGGKLVFGATHTLWAAGNGITKLSTTSGKDRTFRGSISNPRDIVTGPDKSLWFTNSGNNTIGRYVPNKGAVFYSGHAISAPTDLTVGADKGLWFTNNGNNTIGRIGSSTHTITHYGGGHIDAPFGITAGPDGALWFTNNGNSSIGRITTKGVVTNYKSAKIDEPEGIVSGPDGALWFASTRNDSIGRIDATTHTVTTFNDNGTNVIEPTNIISAQGDLWFNTDIIELSNLDKMTTTGVISHRSLGAEIEVIRGLAADAAGRVWFTAEGSTADLIPNKGGIGVRASSTKVLFRKAGSGDSDPVAITLGPDRAMWFVSAGFANSISRITTKS